MRRIEFRAKKDDISNYNFVYGYLVKDEEGNPYIVEYNRNKRYSHVSCVKGTEGQFTGLHDKNGKDVYEGDVHSEKADIDGEIIDCYFPIVYDNGAFWIDESFKKDGTLLTLLCEYDQPLNIAGNIHEKPELLDYNIQKTELKNND